MDYAKPKDASKYYNVSENTLRSWSSQGKIKYITTQGGHRRYCIKNNQIKSKSYIQESLQKNKKKTFKDKQNISNQNTLNINQSQISEAESTSIEKDSDKYWKEFSKETSQKLWLPIKTDLQDLDMTCLNDF